MSTRARAYRLLLRLYPRRFRDRFGAGMEQALRERYHHAAGRGLAAVARLTLNTAADVAGNAILIRFAERERRRMTWQSWWMDARYARRMFARNPVFTVLAIAALALGIGANAAIFTVVNSVLLRPLPYADPGRLVMVWSSNAAERRDHDVVAPLDFLDYGKAAAFEDLQATYSFIVRTSLDSPSGADQILVTAVTPGMFAMLGRQPAMGRVFTA